MPVDQNSHARPVIFGEVLFDCFPDGKQILGGAPFNVAWHLKGFGLNPLFISRVGQDTEGELVLAKMIEWGMDSKGLQLDAKYPTGRVVVSLDNGQPSYDIVDDQAYDFINATLASDMMAEHDCNMLYYGTLATRQSTSRSALEKMRASAVPAFVDINLREPWWDHTMVADAIKGAAIVKLNEIELAEILNCEPVTKDIIKQKADIMMSRYDVKELIVTFGEEGACYIGDDIEFCAIPPAVNKIEDTVGAGDAFTAATIYGIINNWPIEKRLQKALVFAAEVCKQRGATSTNKSLYQAFLNE